MSARSWFSEQLLSWYEEEHRDLPWRRTKDPYRIWLSEVMLQQTRVEQGVGYYERFLDAFPTVHALAAASERKVLRLWQGLGYYSRARNLHAAA
ncbi:MAG: A/G-specific adenine glycosylase, partial [Flavobacteriales bacterium]|nr:A/G-specific adenine glycosylase [Flavobacteriales bacterium]